ncbi:hypothetical protein DF048_32970 [Burkholderia seminalis]|nr:hypothetical protein DF032_32245 [Burkholderia seminalis]RQS85934.1 hypothetical protein DF048_32970 [Burkholderia seminalis]
MTCTVFFSSEPHPDTLSCECHPCSSWIFWKTCAASWSILSAFLVIEVRRGRVRARSNTPEKPAGRWRSGWHEYRITIRRICTAAAGADHV